MAAANWPARTASISPRWWRRTGLPPAEAQRRVAAVETDVRAALDQARRIAMQLAFWLVAAMFLGAFAAGLAATEGGAARDGR